MNLEKLRDILGRITDIGLNVVLPFLVEVVLWSTMVAALYLMAGFFNPAHAQEQAGAIDFTEIRAAASGAGDWSMALWADVLGPFFKDPFGTVGYPTTTLGWLFFTFNTCIFMVTAAYLGYGVLSGIIGTTQDGSLLGSRMNSSWYPIRVATGIGQAMPIMGGFTVSQALLVWLAVAGIGTANLMIHQVVKGDAMVKLTGSASISGAPGVGIYEVASTVEALTRSQICVQSAQRVGEQYKAAGAAGADWWLSYGAQTARTPDGVLIRFGRPGDPEGCGAVGVRLERYREAQSSSAYRVASVDYAGIRAGVSQAAGNQLEQANRIAENLARDYLKAVDAYKKAAAGGRVEVDLEAMEASARAYAADINNLITKAVATGGSSIKQAAQSKMLDGGWMAAGSWYGTWAEANAALADAVAGIKFSRAEPDAVTAAVDEDIRRFDRLLEQGKAAARGLAGNAAKDSSAVAVSEVQRTVCGLSAFETSTGDCSIGQMLVEKFISGVAYGSGGGASERDGVGLINPVVAFKNAGDYVMTVGATLVGAQIAAPVLDATPLGRLSSVAGVVSGKTGEGDKGWGVAASRAAAGISGAGWMVLVLGGLMAIYLPLLPFISWFSAIVTYCASLFEGLVAMPLHSISHMHAEGEGMGQGTAKGYLFYLNTFARPPLMVISFFFAAAMSIGLGTLLAKAFLPAIANFQGNSVTGLASIIGLLIVYVVMNIVVLQAVFDLIQVIPDFVISLVGSGDLNSPLGKDGESKVNALFARAQAGGQSAGMAAAAAGAKQKGPSGGGSRPGAGAR